MILLGVLAGFAVAIGVMISSATSPSVINSVKYFVQSINFMQNVMALKLFDIPWPTVVISLFDWLKFFSFSIAAVRPECAFSWDFETKVGITIISPILLSLAIAFIGVIVGMYKCFNIYIRLDAVRRKLKNSIPYSTFASVVKCWFSVVLFLSVDFNEQTLIWFALSPYLSNRLQARIVKDAKTNWKTASTKLRGLSKASMFMKRMGASASLNDKLDTRDLTKLQDILKNESLDIDFARIVHQGRKFSSGVFSVMVLSFVGTLTSILSVSKCIDRDGSSFLEQDQDVECSFGSPTYARLFSLAIFGFFVYSVFLPLFIVAILGSSWCDQMRRQDYAGYEAIFGFLVARYSRRHYRWEAMVFLMKSASVAVPVYFTNSPIRQSICMMFISLFYIVLLFKHSPFANHFLNFSEKVSNLTLFFMYFSAILLLGSVNSTPIVEGAMREALGIWLCVICTLSIVLTFWCALCELAFLAIVHRDQFASKWHLSLETYFGRAFVLEEGLPSPFAFLYVYYNAVSRKDVAMKTRMYNEAIARKLVKLERANKDVSKRGFSFGIKRKWIYISVSIQYKLLSASNPATVLKALEFEEAKFFRSLSQIEAQLLALQKSAGEALRSESMWSKILNRVRAFFRNRTSSETPSSLNTLAAPTEFVSELQRLRNFISHSFSDDFSDIMLTLLVFDVENQWCCASSKSANYLSKMRGLFPSFKLACRAMVTLDRELELRGTKSPKQSISVMRAFYNFLLGSNSRVFKMFSSSPIEEVEKLLHLCNFQNVQPGDLDATPIPKLVELKLQSFDIEGGNRRDVAKILQHDAPEPTDAIPISRPKVIASAVHRNGNAECSPLFVNHGADILSSAQFVRQNNSTGSNETLEGFQDVSVSSGDRFLGNFVQGLRCGKGTYTWACGDVFEGSWLDDERNGFGILRYQNGDVYDGQWVQGRRSGWGKMTFLCGDTFQGEWLSDNFCGKGAYTFSDGRLLQGQWADGTLVKEYEVDVSGPSKSPAPEDARSSNQENTKAQLNAFGTSVATRKRRGLATFKDLLFGPSQAQPLPVATRFQLSIDSKAQQRSNIPESSAVFGSSSPNIEFGRTMVSRMFDAHHSNSSKASDLKSQVDRSTDLLNSLEMEHATLQSRNEAMKLRLEPLLRTFHEVSANSQPHSKMNAEERVQFDVTRQAALILELTEQIQSLTSETDQLVQELEQEDSEISPDTQEVFEALSRDAEAIAAETSALTADMQSSRIENANLTARSRFISEQNKSFASALKFRFDAPKLNRQ